MVLAADTAVPINQSFVIENEAKHDLLKKASKIASSKLLGHSNDDKIKVRAALLNDDLYQAIENNTESAKVGSTSEKVISHGYHSMTAYTSEAAQTDASPCTTANGFNVCNHGVEDTIAANFLPFGTKVRAPELFGDRIFVVRDRMNSRYSERVDFWFKEKPAALRFGVKYAKIEVVKTD